MAETAVGMLGSVPGVQGRCAIRGCERIGPMQPRGRGRPRKSEHLRPGASTRAEILDAAAELITTQGFGTTTTRQIAAAVGVHQNALYHHFASKDAILGALLEAMVAPALDAATKLQSIHPTDTIDLAVHLYALARFDAHVLANWRWNLGVLFALPEARSNEFSEALTSRRALRDHYLAHSAAISNHTGRPSAGDQPFRLIESVSSMRADGQLPPNAPDTLATSCLLLTGWTTQHDEVRARAAELRLTSAVTQKLLAH